MLHTYDIASDVVAFSTMRNGDGVSIGNYSQMNINPFCGDDPLHVEANRALLAKVLAVDPQHIVLPHQVHKTEIRVVDKSYFSLSPNQQSVYLDGVDALITSCSGVCIGVSTADCVPVLLYDSTNRVIAAIHAGWRGTCARIVAKSLSKLKSQFNSDFANVKAIIGPSISLQSFEVGDEVYYQFAANGFDMPSIATRVNNKWHIDLWEANRLQLLEFGVLPVNIQTSGICTFISHEDFFSARRLGINSGRIYTGILMK